jgi:hypothetical protein
MAPRPAQGPDNALQQTPGGYMSERISLDEALAQAEIHFTTGGFN